MLDILTDSLKTTKYSILYNYVVIDLLKGQLHCLAAAGFADFTEISGLEPKFLWHPGA